MWQLCLLVFILIFQLIYCLSIHTCGFLWASCISVGAFHRIIIIIIINIIVIIIFILLRVIYLWIRSFTRVIFPQWWAMIFSNNLVLIFINYDESKMCIRDRYTVRPMRVFKLQINIVHYFNNPLFVVIMTWFLTFDKHILSLIHI